MLKVATVQFNHAPGDKEYNFGCIEKFTHQASEAGVQILVFPEMCITGYWHVRNLSRGDIASLSESVPDGPSSQRLLRLASEHNLLIGAGFIEQAGEGEFYNTYLVAFPDGTFHSHRKLHCFISEHMKSGEEYTVFDSPFGVKLGVLTCYDNNIIENTRITALRGADILLAPHQTGGCDSSSPEAMGLIDPDLWWNRKENPEAIEAEFRGPKGRGWLMRWLPSRAHDNGMFLLFSNGVGYDDGEVRTGNAMVIDCYGRILEETWQAQDAMVTANLDLSLLEKSTGRRWFRARRPELYESITNPTGKEIDARKARFT